MKKYFKVFSIPFLCFIFMYFSENIYGQDSDFIDTGIATNSNKAVVQPEQTTTVNAKDKKAEVKSALTPTAISTNQQAESTVGATVIITVSTPVVEATPAIVEKNTENEGEGEGIIILSPGEVEPEKLEQYITNKKPIQEISPEKEEMLSVEQPEEEGGGGVIVLEAEGKGKIERAGYIMVERAGFISDNFKEDGLIYSMNGEELMSQEDLAYINISVGRASKSGSEFIIYKDGEDINDPFTDAPLGKLINIVGVAKVIDRAENNQANVYKVKIKKSYEPIRNNLKIKFRKDLKEYYNKLTGKIRKKNLDIEAFIIKVSSNNELINNKNLVYMDKGLDEGLLPGEKLTVYRKSQDQENNDFYDEMGKVVVLNSMKKSSVGIVIKQKDPIKIGDVVKTQK